MKRWHKIVLIVIAVLGILFGGGRLWLHYISVKFASSVKVDNNSFQKALKKLPDGRYIAKNSHGKFMKIDLEVDVSDGKISNIKIISHETGMKKSEKIIPKIIEKQSLDVDSISGATASSKMILQTVEKAIIRQGQE